MQEGKKQMIEEYEINPFTMVIVPISYGSKIYSRIIETDFDCISPFTPFEIIKKGCKYFGSSFIGRKDGTKALIGVTHKPPIAISPAHHIYFFPTTSPQNPQCIWISHTHVLSLQRKENLETKVVFSNKFSFTIPLSYRSCQNQLLRTAQLETKLSRNLDQWHFTSRRIQKGLRQPTTIALETTYPYCEWN